MDSRNARQDDPESPEAYTAGMPEEDSEPSVTAGRSYRVKRRVDRQRFRPMGYTDFWCLASSILPDILQTGIIVIFTAKLCQIQLSLQDKYPL